MANTRENRNVRFSEAPMSSRSGHGHDRDSGFGSLSSDQASTGGKPDRRFTAQDINNQWSDPRAVHEALEAANRDARQYRKKAHDAGLELTNAKKARRETEALWRAEVALNETRKNEVKDLRNENNGLKNENNGLKKENNVLQIQIEDFKADIDEFRDNYSGLEQRLRHFEQPISSPMMSGGFGNLRESVGGTTSKSMRSSNDDINKRLKERIKPPSEAESSSKSRHRQSHESHGRRNSMSVNTGSTTSTGAYIEPHPDNPPHPRSIRDLPYLYATPNRHPATTKHQTPRMANVPMTPRPAASSAGSFQQEYPPQESGNYTQYPLPSASTELHRRISKREKHPK